MLFEGGTALVRIPALHTPHASTNVQVVEEAGIKSLLIVHHVKDAKIIWHLYGDIARLGPLEKPCHVAVTFSLHEHARPDGGHCIYYRMEQVLMTGYPSHRILMHPTADAFRQRPETVFWRQVPGGDGITEIRALA